MRTPTSVTGRIIEIIARDTRYGRRTTATIERIDHSTGEVFDYRVKAWQDQAADLEAQRLGGTVGLSGTWRKLQDGSHEFLVKRVSELRHVDPRTVDVSAYL